jgi:hypothetical protein
MPFAGNAIFAGSLFRHDRRPLPLAGSEVMEALMQRNKAYPDVSETSGIKHTAETSSYVESESTERLRSPGIAQREHCGSKASTTRQKFVDVAARSARVLTALTNNALPIRGTS